MSSAEHSTPPTPSSAVSSTKRTSGMAVASLVLGIVSMCFGLAALVGLPLGISAFVSVNRSNGRIGGGGLAIAGIVTSSIGLLLICVQIGLFLPALAKARLNAQALKYEAQAKEVARALLVYADGHEGRLPASEGWVNELTSQAYIGADGAVLVAPAGDSKLAFNAALDRVPLDDLPSPHITVLVFETDVHSPDAGGPENLAHAPASRRGAVIAFVDGHVEVVDTRAGATLIWDPAATSNEQP